jgi:phosphoglycolate phosphatase
VPRHLFFDLDGTLTDSRLGITRCLHHALVGLSIPPPSLEELTRYVGPPLHDGFAALLGPERAELVPRAVELYRERFRTVGMFENAVYPGVESGLQLLASSGRTLWVVTSKPWVFAEQIVEHFGLRRFFAKVYGSELSGVRSDKGELIAHVLAQESIDPVTALMIGDRSHDVSGAARNGVRAAGVLWGYGSREELVQAGAGALHVSMMDLADSLVSGR